MPTYLQGDVLQVALDRRFDLAIVFGHIGFNIMASSWRSFREQVADWTTIDDPFVALADSQHEYRSGQWIQFVAEQRNHGMTDGQVAKVVDSILLGADQKGVTTVITNGIADEDHGHNTEANRRSDDRRAQFLNQLMAKKERTGNFEVTLISMNDVFVRNFS